MLVVMFHVGEIAADETWAGDDVHVLTDDVTVRPNVTLTIQPGAVVKGQSFTTDLLVDAPSSRAARLRTPSSSPPTTTTRPAATPTTTAQHFAGPNPWGVVLLRGPGNVLEHANVRYGLDGQLTVRGGELALSDSVLRNSRARGCGSKMPIPC